jgi:hypothetical protein
MIPIVILFLMNTRDYQRANDSFFTACKVKTNNVKLEYLDSNHGIQKIEQHLVGDTLVLEVSVSTNVRNESKEINIPERASILKIGRREFV